MVCSSRWLVVLLESGIVQKGKIFVYHGWIVIEFQIQLFSCRFLFGGEHGRLRFPPPYGFSPLYECLLPTQTLALDPCFHFGDLTKSTLAGPLEVLNDTAFVPMPVDTSLVLKR